MERGVELQYVKKSSVTTLCESNRYITYSNSLFPVSRGEDRKTRRRNSTTRSRNQYFAETARYQSEREYCHAPALRLFISETCCQVAENESARGTSAVPVAVTAEVHQQLSVSSSSSESSSSEEDDYVLDDNDIYHAIMSDNVGRVREIVLKHPNVIKYVRAIGNLIQCIVDCMFA